jgi:hypothetical protein
MFWDLERKFASIRRRSAPRRCFETELRKELVPLTTHHSPFAIFLRPSIVAASLVTVLCTGTAAYAYVSEDVLPDHPLYPVRESIERIEEVIAPTADVRATVEVKHAARRADEVRKLTDHRKQVTLEQIEKMNTALDIAETATANTSSSNRGRYDRTLSDIERDQERIVFDLPDRFFAKEDMDSIPPVDEGDSDLNEPVIDDNADPYDLNVNGERFREDVPNQISSDPLKRNGRR